MHQTPSTSVTENFVLFCTGFPFTNFEPATQHGDMESGDSKPGRKSANALAEITTKQEIVKEIGRDRSLVKFYAAEAKSADVFGDYKKEVLNSLEVCDCSSAGFRRFVSGGSVHFSSRTSEWAT